MLTRDQIIYNTFAPNKTKKYSIMDFGFWDVLRIIGALGFFIYGMKVMSDSLQHVAGSKMRQILRAMTSNRYTGVMTGFLITAILQSSSATTVMTVSFVNAGLISLVESAGIMMGANVGTTITGWLVSTVGFKVKIANYALPVIAVAFPFMFSAKQNRKKWAEVAVGFALLFMGLDELKNSVPDLKSNPDLLSFLQGFADPDAGYFKLLLINSMFVLIGGLVTVIIQSSSAAMTLTIVLCAQGILPFPIAAAMVLGENVGTTITAELASVVGNVHAKRSARIHSLFNVIGVSWMLLVLPFFIDIVSYVSSTFFDHPNLLTHYSSDQVANLSTEELDDLKDTKAMGLSIFHTMFNLTNVFLLIGFINFLVRVAKNSVKSKGEEDEGFRLEFISNNVFSSPELSIEEATKEVAKFGEITERLYNFIPELMNETNNKEHGKLIKRIAKYEEITDSMEIEIANFLSKASEGELSETTALRTRGLLSIIGDLERVGDICYQIALGLGRKKESNVYFAPETRGNLEKMFALVSKSIILMNENLNKPYANVSLITAQELEDEINDMRNELRQEHLLKIQKGEHKIEATFIYNDMIHSLEKIGDHVINVTEAIVGEK